MFRDVATPQDRLRDYLAERELTFRAAAKLFKCSTTAVFRYTKGERWPPLDVAFRMEKYTGIDAGEWIRKR